MKKMMFGLIAAMTATTLFAASQATRTYVDRRDGEIAVAASEDATTKANAAKSDAINAAAANAEAKANAAKEAAIAVAASDATTKANAASASAIESAATDATAKANAAKEAAISAASTDATTKANSAKSAAIAAAAEDATTKANAALASAKEYTDTAMTKVFVYKGKVDTVADLDEITEKKIGDTYNVEENGANYAWNGTAWDKLSETIDLSPYALKTEVTAEASARQTADAGLETKIDEAKEDAITSAATDATGKANAAKEAAITAAATDATGKANAAKEAAVSTASADATAKANNALADAKAYADTKKTEAINAAATDATTKANSAKSAAVADAVAEAATDASTKANAALESAKSYADTKKTEAITASSNEMKERIPYAMGKVTGGTATMTDHKTLFAEVTGDITVNFLAATTAPKTLSRCCQFVTHCTMDEVPTMTFNHPGVTFVYDDAVGADLTVERGYKLFNFIELTDNVFLVQVRNLDVY